MEELGTGLEKFMIKFEGNGSDRLMDHLKTLSPSQLDYELQRFLFGNLDNISKMASFFAIIFESPDDFDLKNAYFKR